MPPVTHNMILGMRAYRVVNRGIPRAYMGMMPGHTCAIVGIVRGSVI